MSLRYKQGRDYYNTVVRSEIADQFKASVTATLIKIVKSGDHPIVLVCHDCSGRRWSWPSSMVPGWWRLQSDLDLRASRMGYCLAEHQRRSGPVKSGLMLGSILRDAAVMKLRNKASGLRVMKSLLC